MGEQVLHHFKDQMGGGPETGEAETLTIAHLAQGHGTVPDGTGAEQWRGLNIGKTIGNRKREFLMDGHVFSVPAVGIPSGGGKRRAKVLQAFPAVVAMTASMIDPGNPHPVDPL